MESQRLAETRGFPPIAGPPLTDRGMPALHRSPLARFLVHRAVGRLGEDGSIGRPEVAIASTTSIGFRDGFPKLPTGGFASVSHDAGHDLSSAPTSRPSGPSAPQNSQDVPSLGRPQGPGYRGDRPDGDPIQPRPSPRRTPPDRPAESAPSAPPCTAPWAPGPHRPRRPCRDIAGSRIDSVRSGRCPHSRICGTGKSGSPES